MRRWGIAVVAVLIFAAPILAEGEEEEIDWKKLVKDLQKEVKTLKNRVKDLESEKAAGECEIYDHPTFKEEGGSITHAIDQVAGANTAAPRSSKLTIGGQLRIQPEIHSNRDLNSDVGDTREYVGMRTQVWFDFDILEWLRAFAMFQDSRFWGEERSVVGDLEGLDLREGYVDFRKIFGEGWNLKLGRKKMKYGKQRLISDLDWSIVGRSWDGGWLEWDFGSGFAHLFGTRIDEMRNIGTATVNEDFYGIYSGFDLAEHHNAEAYVFYRYNQDKSAITGEDGMGGREQLWTLGARFFGDVAGFHYDVEGAYQGGDYANDDIQAFMLEADVSCTFDFDWKPKLGAAFIWASGDDDPTDGKRQTFDPLYTFGHYYLGYVDLVGRRNIRALKAYVAAKPGKDWTVAVDAHFFWLDQTTDALYNALGKPIRGPDPTADSNVGWELDFWAKAVLTKHLKLWFGYSHFFAGQFLKDTGPSDDIDFVWLQITVDF